MYNGKWAALPFVYTDCLYLDEPSRGQGYGTELLATLKDFARARDCHHIEWQTPPDNRLGIAVYFEDTEENVLGL